ncbi:MAG: glycosyltransferase family 4 protein [Clostridia bacterium]|nr:glycosyltransferase family 4 protein [Clostridia bacterium]
MRILLVNYRYFISGGPERMMFNVKALLESHGHEVIPFSVRSSKNVDTPYAKYFVEPIGGEDAVYYEDYKKTPKVIMQLLSRSIYSFKVKHAIQKEIRDVKPDLVYIIHMINKLSPSVIRGAKQLGVPVVMRLSDFFMFCPKFDFLRDGKICRECMTGSLVNCLKHRCVKGSLSASLIRVFAMKVHRLIRVYDDVSAFVAPSSYMAQVLRESSISEERIRCIPSFTYAGEADLPDCVGDFGLYLGRLSPEKGPEVAVKAYEKLRDHRLVIVGDDNTEEGKRLKEYVKEKGLTNIEFRGFLQGRALHEVINASRFMIIPSICYENMPNTALEAMQYAKPILISRIGSLPDLVEDGKSGFLFECGNPDSLAQAIERMSDDGQVKEMGIVGRRLMQERFSPEAHYEKLIGLFNKVRGSAPKN